MKHELENSIAVLKKGGIIVYPTDTIWGIGCDATNPVAVEKIFKLKKRAESKSFICLVSDFSMLKQYVQKVPEVAYDILKNANTPTTIVYDKPVQVSENLIAEDDSLAIRVVRDEFCKRLIQQLKKPIVSTSANISGAPAPGDFGEIASEILEGVDYVVNLHRNKKFGRPSAIIKLSNSGLVKVIRS